MKARARLPTADDFSCLLFQSCQIMRVFTPTDADGNRGVLASETTDD
jgi:hypothetical protein